MLGCLRPCFRTSKTGKLMFCQADLPAFHTFCVSPGLAAGDGLDIGCLRLKRFTAAACVLVRRTPEPRVLNCLPSGGLETAFALLQEGSFQFSAEPVMGEHLFQSLLRTR